MWYNIRLHCSIDAHTQSQSHTSFRTHPWLDRFGQIWVDVFLGAETFFIALADLFDRIEEFLPFFDVL